MTPRRPGVTLRQIGLLAAVGAVLSLLLGVVVRRNGSYVVAPSWIAVALLLFIAALVVVVVWPVRTYQRAAQANAGRRPPRVDPLRAARALFLAQAAALTGGGAAGWYLGQILSGLADLDLTAVQHAEAWLVAALVASLLVSATGLWGQWVCRIDPPDDGDEPQVSRNGVPGPA